nr:MAG TPA: hypothetical protein [Caudoviricetes sp.]
MPIPFIKRKVADRKACHLRVRSYSNPTPYCIQYTTTKGSRQPLPVPRSLQLHFEQCAHRLPSSRQALGVSLLSLVRRAAAILAAIAPPIVQIGATNIEVASLLRGLTLPLVQQVVGLDSLLSERVVVPPRNHRSNTGDAGSDQLLDGSRLNGQDGLAHCAENLIGQGQQQDSGTGDSSGRDFQLDVVRHNFLPFSDRCSVGELWHGCTSWFRCHCPPVGDMRYTGNPDCAGSPYQSSPEQHSVYTPDRAGREAGTSHPP